MEKTAGENIFVYVPIYECLTDLLTDVQNIKFVPNENKMNNNVQIADIYFYVSSKAVFAHKEYNKDASR